MAFLDSYAETTDLENGSVLIEFLLGPGNAWVKNAALALEQRQGEIENQEAVEDLTASGQKFIERGTPECDADEFNEPAWDEGFLDSVHGFLQTAQGMLKKKKQQKPLSAAQATKVEEVRTAVRDILDKVLGHHLPRAVRQALDLTQEALQNDGYVKTSVQPVGDEVSEVQGAVSMSVLEDLLCAPSITIHGLWPEFPNKLVQRYKETSRVMLSILQHVLADTKALRAVDYMAPKNNEPSGAGAVDLVEEWLLQDLGLPKETVSDQWRLHCATPFLKRKAREQEDAFPIIKALVGDCVAGKFAGIERRTVESCLGKLPKKCELKPFLRSFFKAVQEYTLLISGGSLASIAQILTFQATAAHVLETLCLTASGQECGLAADLVKHCGLDQPEVKDWVESLSEKAAEKLAKVISLRESRLSALSDATVKALALVPTTVEKDFRTKMHQHGNTIATHQKEITDLLGELQSVDPTVEGGTASGQPGITATRQPQLAEKAKTLADRCLHYTCTYVAFTLWRGMQAAQDGEASAPQKAKLEQVLASMSNLTELQTQIFPAEIKLMKVAAEVCLFVAPLVLPCLVLPCLALSCIV